MPGVLLALAICAPALAQGGDRWAADETQARATLPAAGPVTGALACAAQRWTLALTPPDGLALPAGAVTMTIDGRPFELAATEDAGAIALRLPREALRRLGDGLRMELVFSGAPEDVLAFPLRGSKLAIAAVEERCSLRDMSAYQTVTFTPFSSYLTLARELRDADIEAFAVATASQPKVDAAMAELGEGRRILFTRLCGSSWYFGESGCNITGFAPGREPEGDGAPPWRAVYDTENVALHIDPNATSHGWPDLVTLPARGRGAGLVWRWDGRAYRLKGELPPDAAEAGVPGLRPSQE